MESITFIPMISLQLFAEGGAPGAGAGDGGTASGQGVTAAAALPQKKADKGNPLADVKYGTQEQPKAPVAEVQETKPAAPEDRSTAFERMIKGEYKAEYDARVQDTIQKRLRGTKETVDKYNAIAPTLDLLAKHYGIDAADTAALAKAVEEDDSLLEAESLRTGKSIPELREDRKREAKFRAMENENAELRRQMQEQGRRESAAKQYAAWVQQAEDAKKFYPGLDLETEAKNPEFLKLLRSGIDVGSAYLVIHKDDIFPAVMQHTAQTVEQKLADKIIAGGARPSENGMSSQSAAVTKSDVSQLTRADRDEIRRRVARGEKIRFG